MSEEPRDEERERIARIAHGVLAVREGHGANCSSIGSVIDTLFAAAVVGGAVLAAVAAALAKEDVRIAGPGKTSGGAENAPDASAPDEEPRA